MQLGAFSISLVVKDLAKSMAFYETLGFSRFGGTDEHGYAVLKNGETLVDPFDDVRDIKAKLKVAGHEVSQEAGDVTGPGSFVVTDPDGNPVLIDQHR